jgi:hypothetical protein
VGCIPANVCRCLCVYTVVGSKDWKLIKITTAYTAAGLNG